MTALNTCNDCKAQWDADEHPACPGCWGDPAPEAPPKEKPARRSQLDVLRIQTAAELLRRKLPEAVFVVQGLLPEAGFVMLVSRPKLGKSWLLLGIGCAVALGGVALGQIDVPQGDVLYLALEDTERRLQSRLQILIGEDIPPDRLFIATEWPKLDRGGLEALEEWLKAHPDCRLLIIDVFAKVRPTPNKSVNIYDADYAAASMLKTLGDTYGVCVVVAHHDRKADAEDWVDAISGSAGLSGAADALLRLTRKRAQTDGVLSVTGRDIEEAELALDFDSALGMWQLHGDASAWRKSRERGEVLAAVAALARPVSAREVADYLDRKEENVRRMMSRMAEAGELGKAGRGLYTVPADPLSQVSESPKPDGDRDNETDGTEVEDEGECPEGTSADEPILDSSCERDPEIQRSDPGLVVGRWPDPCGFDFVEFADGSWGAVPSSWQPPVVAAPPPVKDPLESRSATAELPLDVPIEGHGDA